tara:strand:+ start:330 stop:506 length:177 start_codon:yes stop_codon:yes gene_type:complete
MKYKIEYQSIWETPQIFETNSKKECDQIVFDGHQQQYLVLVNGQKKSALNYKIKRKGN